MGYKRAQYELTSTIINVPVDFDRIQQTLPRYSDETQTIVVRIKHKLQYENAYAQENVRPSHVMNALTILSKTPLYVKSKVTIKKDWETLLITNRQ